MLKSYNEEIIVKKDKLKFIFTLILTAFLFSCKASDTKSGREMRIEKFSKMIENNKVSGKGKENEFERTPFVLDDYDLVYIQALYTGTNIGKDNRICYTDVEVIKFEREKEIECRQKRTAKNGKDFFYSIKYEWDKIAKKFINTKYEFEQELNIGGINEKIIKKQVHGIVIESKEDPDKERLIPMFESYMTKLDKNDKYHYTYYVLDYIRGNFTNSGYDEYIVFFTNDSRKEMEEAGEHHPNFYSKDGKLSDITWKNNICDIACFIVEGSTFKKVYDIYFRGSIFLPAYEKSSSLYGSLNPRQMPYITNFGKQFFQGWVADLNQNGINEIYIYFPWKGTVRITMAEFIDKDFEFKCIEILGDEFNNVDWHKKTFNGNYYSIELRDDTYGILWYKEIFQWNEDDDNYWLQSCNISPNRSYKMSWDWTKDDWVNIKY